MNFRLGKKSQSLAPVVDMGEPACDGWARLVMDGVSCKGLVVGWASTRVKARTIWPCMRGASLCDFSRLALVELFLVKYLLDSEVPIRHV